MRSDALIGIAFGAFALTAGCAVGDTNGDHELDGGDEATVGSVNGPGRDTGSNFQPASDDAAITEDSGTTPDTSVTTTDKKKTDSGTTAADSTTTDTATADTTTTTDTGTATTDTATTDTASASDATTTTPTTGWLTVSGNKILGPDGKPFHGRGANLHDTRSCDACTWMSPDVPGLERWSDELIDNWHANLIRFDLEAYATNGGFRTQWQSLTLDAGYLADTKAVVTHMTSKPGVYVMVTVFMDPSIKPDNGDYDSEWPTAATMPVYQLLAEAFHDNPKVLFGLTNEPHGPATYNAQLAARYTTAISTIRTVEAKYGTNKHVVVVQAPQSWSRDLSYFMSTPLTGENIAYEVHVYDPSSTFNTLIVNQAKALPIIIGEYGVVSGYMTDADVKALWTTAQTYEIPHIAWNFHQRCPPNLLQDTASDGCGLSASTGYAFPRTAWGELFHTYMATPW